MAPALALMKLVAVLKLGRQQQPINMAALPSAIVFSKTSAVAHIAR
jgi:hypothetical protein